MMQIIDLRQNSQNGAVELSRHLLIQNHGMAVSELQPSGFSFITSTRLANVLKKTKAQIVVVDRLKDAIAAVSARKLLPKDIAAYKLVYSVSALQHMPTGVPTEVCRGIDCWVFDAESTKQAYSENEFIEVHSSVIIPPTSAIDMHAHKNTAMRESLHITVVGDLADADRLQRTVRAVASCDRGKVELHVYGTGKPRYIMPIVNEARHLDGLSIVWHGSEYKLEAVAADTDIAVGAYAVPDSVDIFFRSLGIPVVEPEKIAEIIATPESMHAAAETSLSDYRTLYSPEAHVEQWRKLIENLA